MQEAIEKANSVIDAAHATVEAAQEPDQVEETEQAAEDVAETPEADEPDEIQEESAQVLTAEYDDILVDVDGEQTSLKDLKAGTLRQADYTRKTQALKEERAALEKEREDFKAEMEAREQQLSQLAAEFEEPEPDWDRLFEEDPLGAPREKLKWDQKQAKKAEQRREQEARNEKMRREFQAKTGEMAIQIMPEWADLEVFKQGVDARKKAALEAGFTEQEYQSTHDFRLAVLLEKAARYDAMQADGKQKLDIAEKKIAKAPKVLRPGQSKGDSDPKAERRAARQKRLSSGPVSSAELMKEWGLS